MVLRRIYGPKRDEVTGGWSGLHNEDFSNLYSSPSKIILIKSRMMKWTGNVARIYVKSAYRLLMTESEGKRPLGIPRRRW
jgi:hypothetical protein